MHLRYALCFSCLVVCLGGSHVALAEGKLAQARREASADDSDEHSDSSSHQRRRGHSRHHDDCSQGFVEALVCGLLGCSDSCDSGEVEVSGAAGYYIEEPPAAPPPAYARYPYASPLAPYLLDPELQVASTSSELDLQLHRERPIGRPFAGQLGLDAGYLDGIAHSGFEARLLTPSPFELGARHRFMYEPSAGDYSLFGAADLGMRFASLNVLLMRVFAGPLYFGKPGEMVVGGEVGVSVELFLGRPWVLSARVAGGVLQNDLLIPQARIQLGYLVGSAELFVGYDYLQIGSVDLGTPIFGTRIWL